MKQLWSVCVIVFAVLGFTRPASAAPPPWVHRAIVTVDAWEHTTNGVAIGDGRRVLVPYRAIEVDHPGSITVRDVEGRAIEAWVTTTDEASGLALLETAEPIAISLQPSTHPLLAPGIFAVTNLDATSATWTPFAIADDMKPVVDGTPIVDEAGDLVGLMGARNDGPIEWPKRLLDAHAGLKALMAPHADRSRRQFIFYGGGSMQVDFAGKGGVWWGGSFSLGVRWRDLIEARVDNELSFLLPTAKHPECVEPPCFAGGRGVVTPSFGPRIALSRPGPGALAITPSLGYAFGAQFAGREAGAPIFDADTRPTWARIAPGVAFQVGAFEMRFRARLARGADPLDAPMYELAFAGIYW